MEKKTNGHVPKLHFGRMVNAVSVRAVHAANIPPGTTIETVMNPEFWAHYVQQIRPNDIIECMAEDGSWEASFRVMYVGTAEVRVSLRWKAVHEAVEIDAEDGSKHFIKWISPPKKFGIIRTSDNVVVQDGLYPKSQALEALRSLG